MGSAAVHGVSDFSQFSKSERDGLVDCIVSVLSAPELDTVVSQQYASRKVDQATAKTKVVLRGRNWTFPTDHAEISIGRNSDQIQTAQKHKVDIDLAPGKTVSRRHATIARDEARSVWQLKVLGRNGAKLNFKRVPGGKSITPLDIQSGSIIDICGVQMIFLVPGEDPQVDMNSFSYLIPSLVTMYGLHGNNNTLLQSIINSSKYLEEQKRNGNYTAKIPAVAPVASVADHPGDESVPMSETTTTVDVPSEKPEKIPQKPVIEDRKNLGISTIKAETADFYSDLRATPSSVTKVPSIPLLQTSPPREDGQVKLASSPAGKTVLPGSPLAQNAVKLNAEQSPTASKVVVKDAKSVGQTARVEQMLATRAKKPSVPYSTMIAQAILSNPRGCLSLSEIYEFISASNPYYKMSLTNWKNSVRHNLSVNPSFEKMERGGNPKSKGMDWRISKTLTDEFLVYWYRGKTLRVSKNLTAVLKELQLYMSTHNELPGQDPPETYQK
ncbi:forkhead family transcription factor FKH1 KNAG_0E01750 [Huiozyma naganishii CBS 8797]|uniref:FHA domain-containing protein n=1 Tax=Huiozyma naganishii (strain ATCC MYA-139 / BCRC 22969 / CBS 8797 / KCTC 17520 / NBRC 10181 / NCYC 3082 / Yp74L-3) TaxID=1071383 RepID=J7RZ16_HUIN7|nr:hypothetical protein KNAG_0E01750 [Kazachstania naganishii CBS 8797]CCK70437.1 hypothetical protein KNAG_0E01750 [Kazachstania naganishii CBS 8797]